MTRGRIPIITNYAPTDLVHLKVDPYGGDPTSQAAPVSSFFAHIPATVNLGLGVTAYDHWGIAQSWNTGSPPANNNCGGGYMSTSFKPATDDNNDAYGWKVGVVCSSGTPVGGYPTSHIIGVEGVGRNLGAQSHLDKIFGGSFEARQYGEDVGELYAVMAQAANQSAVDGTTTRITGMYADAYTSVPDGGNLVVGTLYGAELRTFGKTNFAAGNSAITTAYGLYSAVYCQQEAGGSTSTIGTAYNLYLTDLRPAGGIDYGTVTDYYGIYLPEATIATNNWAIYAEGRSHFDQPTNDAAVPVVTLDQADISEGFINFIGSDRGVITGATNSTASVRAEIGGVVHRLALYADA